MKTSEKLIHFRSLVVTMFGSTYLCEQLFSSLKFHKLENRISLTNEHLNDCMKITFANSFKPNIEKIVSEMQCHVSTNKNK